MALIEFGGNCPANVARDAKYSLRRKGMQWAIRLEYRIENHEKLLLSTEDHPKLVSMVQAVQEDSRGQPGGAFYINEYSQVIVPSGTEGEYYLAGEYASPLKFEPVEDPELTGWIISGAGKDRQDNQLEPGDDWVGPHPGIPYVLSANLQDVYYELAVSPIRIRKVTLSGQTSLVRAKQVAKQVAEAKGSSGRFYINEFCQLFAPVWDGRTLRYTYVGGLDLDAGWFTKWQP